MSHPVSQSVRGPTTAPRPSFGARCGLAPDLLLTCCVLPSSVLPACSTPVNTAYTVGAGKGLGGNAAQGAHQEITIFYTNNAYYKLQVRRRTVYRRG